jgi:hypothetical protein
MLQKEFEGAVDMYLGAASGQKLNFGFRVAGPHYVTDLELPFPHVNCRRLYNRIVHAFVVHRGGLKPGDDIHLSRTKDAASILTALCSKASRKSPGGRISAEAFSRMAICSR